MIMIIMRRLFRLVVIGCCCSRSSIVVVHGLSASSSSISTATTTPPAGSIPTVPLAYTKYYSTTSTQQRPPALFLHGLLGNKRNFGTIATSLGERLVHPRTLVGVDLRHHGESVSSAILDTDTTLSYTSMAHDILQFMDDHAMETAELIGHSVGGKVAQAVALLAPDRIVGLVVLDIAPVTYTTDEPQWHAVAEILRIIHSSGNDNDNNTSRETMDRWLKKQGITDPAIRAFVLTNFTAGVGWTIPMDLLYRELETLAGFSLEEDTTPQTQQPIIDRVWHGDAFFMHGGQSRFVRAAHVATIGRYFPHHLLTTVRGAGHWIHAEAPDDTTALLQQYLDR